MLYPDHCSCQGERLGLCRVDGRHVRGRRERSFREVVSIYIYIYIRLIEREIKRHLEIKTGAVSRENLYVNKEHCRRKRTDRGCRCYSPYCIHDHCFSGSLVKCLSPAVHRYCCCFSCTVLHRGSTRVCSVRVLVFHVKLFRKGVCNFDRVLRSRIK